MTRLQVTGDFMLICPVTRLEFNPGELVEVQTLSHFMVERMEVGQLAAVGGIVDVPLPDPAKTDDAVIAVKAADPEPDEEDKELETAEASPTPPSKSSPAKRGKGRR